MNRLGQTREVNVYRLVAKHTIEDAVLDVQEQKARLIGQVRNPRRVDLFLLMSKQVLSDTKSTSHLCARLFLLSGTLSLICAPVRSLFRCTGMSEAYTAGLKVTEVRCQLQAATSNTLDIQGKYQWSGSNDAAGQLAYPQLS